MFTRLKLPLVVFVAMKPPTVFAPLSVVPPTDDVVNSPAAIVPLPPSPIVPVAVRTLPVPTEMAPLTAMLPAYTARLPVPVLRVRVPLSVTVLNGRAAGRPSGRQ